MSSIFLWVGSILPCDLLGCVDVPEVTLLVSSTQPRQTKTREHWDRPHPTLLVARLSGPVKELDDVLSHLTHSGHSTIWVVNRPVRQGRCHADGGAGEPWVEVLTLSDFQTRWQILSETSQQGKDVVQGVVPGLGHQGEVRGVGPVVGGSSLVFVGIRTGEGVDKFARPLEVFTLVIRPIDHQNVLSFLLRLLLSVGDPDKVAVVDSVHWVTRGAHLLVHLVAAPQS